MLEPFLFGTVQTFLPVPKLNPASASHPMMAAIVRPS